MPPTRRDGGGVVFVTTLGRGSLDRYSHKLAEHLRVATVTTGVYQQQAALFNVPFLSRPSLAALRRDLAFLRLLRRASASLLHLPNHHLGRYARFLSSPYLVTVHDLIRYFDMEGRGPFIHRPNGRDRLFLRLDYAGIRRAAAVIAVSESTKRDLVAHLGVAAERVFVVHEGVDHDLFRPVAARPLDAPYLLFVGSEHPRKNLVTLLRAFARLKERGEPAGLKLVKVGAAGGGEAPFRERTRAAVAALGLEREVVFTGEVADAELPGWYSGARCFVLPSLYEGFGLPVLEAMACGCPVVVANATALPEVAGGAALAVDPLDERALAAALASVLADERRRRELVERGLRRAAGFSWQRAARETEAVYEAVLARFRTGIEYPRIRNRVLEVDEL